MGTPLDEAVRCAGPASRAAGDRHDARSGFGIRDHRRDDGGVRLGRYRYDLVAAGALLAALAAGIVKPDDAFKGFSDEIVIIVGSALIVSAAISRSGVTEAALRRFAPNISAPRSQLVVLVLIVTVLSAFVKNIGALAIMLPIAFQMAKRRA